MLYSSISASGRHTYKRDPDASCYWEGRREGFQVLVSKNRVETDSLLKKTVCFKEGGRRLELRKGLAGVEAFMSHSRGFLGHLHNMDFSVYTLSPVILHTTSWVVCLISILNLYSGMSVLVVWMCLHAGACLSARGQFLWLAVMFYYMRQCVSFCFCYFAVYSRLAVLWVSGGFSYIYLPLH